MDEFLELVKSINKEGTVNPNLVPKPKMLNEINMRKINSDIDNLEYNENLKLKQRIKELEKENEELSSALLEEPDKNELASLKEDLEILSKQDAHREHMENLELKQKILELEKCIISNL